MSRSTRKGTKSKGSKSSGTTGPPPNHPLENNPGHVAFLFRSMERNDVDLAALVKLNDSLHKAKEQILQSCGELVLLDLGSGRLRLVGGELSEDISSPGDGDGIGRNSIVANETGEKFPTENEENEDDNQDVDDGVGQQSYSLSPAQKKICIDFLLRMKLRRKLCNRLVRRLNRLAHAMDGKDVQPPPAPRYGDLRLNIDPEAVKARVLEWKEKAEAKARIEASLTASDDAKPNDDNEDADTKAEEKTETATADEDEGQEGETGEESTSDPIKSEKISSNNDDKKESSSIDGPDSMDVEKDENNAPEKKNGDEAKDDEEAEKTDEQQKKEDGAKDGASMVDESSPPSVPTLDEDYATLKTYDTAYEKSWDPAEKSFKYNLLDDPTEEEKEPEYAQITVGTGIGAVARLHTVEEREAEYNRWQTNIINCHPEQPTLEELGLKNRVFFLEERRKRCLEEAAAVEVEEDTDGTKPSPSPLKKSKSSDEEAISPVKRTSGKELRKKVAFNDDEEENEKDDEEDKDTMVASDGAKKSDAATKKEQPKKEASEPEEKRPISLKPIPSFFEQDIMRIKNVQRDLIESDLSLKDSTRLSDTTKEYNYAFSVSLKLYERLNAVHQAHALAVHKVRQDAQTIAKSHAFARVNWLAEKQTHDLQRAATVLPSKLGQPIQGTEKIKAYMTTPGNMMAQQVAMSLGDIVDGCVAIAGGKTLPAKFRDYVAPPGNPSTVYQDAQQNEVLMEQNYAAQMAKINEELRQSEENRHNRWRRLMQAKAAVGATHELIDPRSGKYNRKARVTNMNFMQFPCPRLTHTRVEPVPRQIVQPALFATYTPPAPPARPGTSTSKYSAARVKARIAADGTVKPVSEPNRDENGLFLRPSGRARKGMLWDAVNGVWVPE